MRSALVRVRSTSSSSSDPTTPAMSRASCFRVAGSTETFSPNAVCGMDPRAVRPSSIDATPLDATRREDAANPNPERMVRVPTWRIASSEGPNPTPFGPRALTRDDAPAEDECARTPRPRARGPSSLSRRTARRIFRVATS